MKPVLIVMVKEARLGRVKTRLGRDWGMGRATWWYRHQTAQTLRRLQDPRWSLVLAVTPDRATKNWPAHLVRVSQGHGNLGARMSRVLSKCGPWSAFLIGSDIPGIRKTNIASAFAKLGTHDAVIGPATDGGYWGVGLRHPTRQPAGFMRGVRWSTEHAMEDTLASASSLNWGTLETLSDVDTVADLERLGFTV
ncbi:TIGR04282 family arsenosugar biosynthesis glycosyltransferase [Celeribacter litoreus]|uniref:TIGR04282 family arsenosugar biosynthesis glycosyltransferase n=1 Tax=Celeribacter litoreus TaxID=2876714 RepID=UPI001CCC6AB9|nr:TIGR04282 family arsenosugar biosynthesis glycosyltransferase [Celeribacter litoreus]MCA0042034.1 TIGR04282 family arsenosugar biosynthesis glycosyltransferase [Celeribacter litoreus]